MKLSSETEVLTIHYHASKPAIITIGVSRPAPAGMVYCEVFQTDVNLCGASKVCSVSTCSMKK